MPSVWEERGTARTTGASVRWGNHLLGPWDEADLALVKEVDSDAVISGLEEKDPQDIHAADDLEANVSGLGDLSRHQRSLLLSDQFHP
ncbi:hypothetical protein CesoFtcFv8_024944 [Champsocephalus esox]|uniref:Uncharacterized protein n=1 Tax=Champsocephalus esox TaxID=159716 RepID=A0AAN8B2U4_9TELE|nr:hypothetical protein CesoFtcFv8_024944 [Champsocephalus esox]